MNVKELRDQLTAFSDDMPVLITTKKNVIGNYTDFTPIGQVENTLVVTGFESAMAIVITPEEKK